MRFLGGSEAIGAAFIVDTIATAGQIMTDNHASANFYNQIEGIPKHNASESTFRMQLSLIITTGR